MFQCGHAIRERKINKKNSFKYYSVYLPLENERELINNSYVRTF